MGRRCRVVMDVPCYLNARANKTIRPWDKPKTKKNMNGRWNLENQRSATVIGVEGKCHGATFVPKIQLVGSHLLRSVTAIWFDSTAVI